MMIGVFSVGIYKFGWNDNATMELSRIVPYPAFFVNGTPVSYARYQDYQKAYSTYITEFYIKGEKKIDVNSDEAKKTLADAKVRIKELLVKNAIVREEVKKRKIKYNQKEIDDSFNEFVKRTGGETEVKNNLKKYYGLTLERFKSEFYIDTFLNGKLQNDIQNDKSLNTDAEKKANEVLAKVKAGEDFAELAKKYSEDTTAAKGGDLGSVKKGQLVPEFEDALWKLTAGQASELVKTVYGYHIIKLTAINGEERTASHILIKTKDFDTWIEDQVKNAKVKYWVK
jgi:foldase protein PrsA